MVHLRSVLAFLSLRSCVPLPSPISPLRLPDWPRRKPEADDSDCTFFLRPSFLSSVNSAPFCSYFFFFFFFFLEGFLLWSPAHCTEVFRPSGRNCSNVPLLFVFPPLSPTLASNSPDNGDKLPDCPSKLRRSINFTSLPPYILSFFSIKYTIFAYSFFPLDTGRASSQFDPKSRHVNTIPSLTLASAFFAPFFLSFFSHFKRGVSVLLFRPHLFEYRPCPPLAIYNLFRNY